MTLRTCCPLDQGVTSGGVVCGGSARVDVVEDVYDGLACIYPLDEFGDGTEDEYKDRSRFRLHGQGGGGQLDLVPTADIGVFCSVSQHFDGRQFITLPQDYLADRQGFTVSAWTKIDSVRQDRSWYSRGFETTSEFWVFRFGHTFLNQLTASVQVYQDSGSVKTYEAWGSTRLAQAAWHHVAVVFEPGVSLRLYLDGELDGETALSEKATVTATNGGFVGRWNEASMPMGNVQELRVYGSVMPQEYLLADYDNFCSAGFFEVGGEESTYYS